ncbi:hypothetical protein Tco_0002598 [Tanacetum coccineum]
MSIHFAPTGWCRIVEAPHLLGLKVFLMLLKLLLQVMIVTIAGYVSTAGEVQRKYSKSLLLLVVKLLLLVLVTNVREVILNGDSPLPTRTIDGVETAVPPTTAEQKLVRKNELKIYEAEVMGSSRTSQNTQNVAFVSSNSTGSTNEAVKTAHDVSAANSKANASTLPNVDSLSDVVIYSFFARDRLEVAEGNADNESKKISQEDRKESSYDWSDQAEEGPTNCSLMAYTSSSSSSSDNEVSTYSKACLESIEARLDVYKKNEVVSEEDIKILKLDIKLRDNALTKLRKKFKKDKKERDDLKLTLEKFENSSKNLSKLLDSQVSDKFKTGVGYDSQGFDSQVNDKYKTVRNT